ncbi:fumarate hydratase [Methanosalsum natronophilum]|uniref:fumarate hydratase n=1 Tax=Methanosalsum natronophilum TaxID=768733 RepID=UPI00216A892A|nr:fumarate hydratase [Methanosalsum natronophilum]MCS3923077.1 fumarate hydratase subunit alpha [Methanosalsum natronophilum]
MEFICDKEITYDTVVKATYTILKDSQTNLPEDIIDALKTAKKDEMSDLGKAHLNAIIDNIELSSQKGIPMCQDTGILVFYVDIGKSLTLNFDISDAIKRGVDKATKQIPLRPNSVHPITRINSGNNLGEGIPDINFDVFDGSGLKLTVAPKGAGSENMSALRMFNPNTPISTIDDFIVETVLNAGGMPCPPVIVGVGIGGSFDKSARLSKKALLRDINSMNTHELSVLKKINSLGIGPMGTGGKYTAIGVLINKAFCHTASLPVAINIQCWANRHSSILFEA